MRSGVVWLSSSAGEIARARSVIAALRKPGVIDELGFLMLNAAFAERLYPAVNTIMTRARYLIFIPALYSYLEQSRKAEGKDADRVARDMQFALRNALAKNEDSYMGKEGGRNLIRTPATVYWTAFTALGIATRHMSEAGYQRGLSAGIFGRPTFADDDRVSHDGESESLWSPSLRLGHVMTQAGEFPDATSFALRKSEALFLASAYASIRPGGRENLVSRMVALGQQHGAESLAGVEYPWDVPGPEQETASILGHARLLSLLARGATLQYSQMLIEKRGDETTDVAEAFEAWWGLSKDELSSWNLQAFFDLLIRWGAGRGARDREFIAGWIERLRQAKAASAALKDGGARSLLSSRERVVRPGKERLRIKHQLDTWNVPPNLTNGAFQMDYRHRVGRQFAMDIVDGLRRGQA